jgi:hypothetical protein
MKVLEGFDDVIVPNKNIDCSNNELVQPRFVKQYKKQYEELTKTRIKTNQALIDQFYLYNQDFEYVGFKTMPLRHKANLEFMQRDDIQFVALIREDIPSTVASFIAARKRNTWDRKGGANQTKLVLKGFDKLMVWGNIRYIRESLKLINNTTDAIHIKYEDLCNPNFSNSALNEFFNRPIKLAKPVRPTSGEDYMEDWEGFKRFVERTLK